jgi:uncharacterized membrane protein YfcA
VSQSSERIVGIWLSLAFLVVACIYASAGFAGGSTYTALLALADGYGQGPGWLWIRPASYVCNLVVSLGGVAVLHRYRLVPLRPAVGIVAASLPAAWIAAAVPIGRQVFLISLCGALVIAGLTMLCLRRSDEGIDLAQWSWRQAWKHCLPIGIVVGFLAGLTGIGGGIYLAPWLHFRGFGRARQIAALATLTIALNSVAGLASQLRLLGLPSPAIRDQIFGLAVAAFCGGQLGSRLLRDRLPAHTIRRITGFLLLVVAALLVQRILAPNER